jgi:hypothetical protein
MLWNAACDAGSSATGRDGMMYDILQKRYPMPFLRKVLYITTVNQNAAGRGARLQAENALCSAKVAAVNSIVEAWPSIPDESFILQQCSEYVKATAITPPAPCGRSFLTDQLTASFSFPFSDSLLLLGHPLHLLSANQSMVAMFKAPFSNHTTVLDGLMLHHDYVTIDSISQTISLNLCSECIASLNSKRLPCFSLRNNLFRGWLPMSSMICLGSRRKSAHYTE